MHNRGPETAQVHLLPTLWFRNTWSWGEDEPKPVLREGSDGAIRPLIRSSANTRCNANTPELLFTENETNTGRLWGQANPSPYVKDAFHEYVISGTHEVVNPSGMGTKAAAHYRLEVPAGGSKVVRFRLSAKPPVDAFEKFDEIFSERLADADEFYERITPNPSAKPNVACIARRWLECCGLSSITISISIDG